MIKFILWFFFFLQMKLSSTTQALLRAKHSNPIPVHWLDMCMFRHGRKILYVFTSMIKPLCFHECRKPCVHHENPMVGKWAATTNLSGEMQSAVWVQNRSCCGLVPQCRQLLPVCPVQHGAGFELCWLTAQTHFTGAKLLWSPKFSYSVGVSTRSLRNCGFDNNQFVLSWQGLRVWGSGIGETCL